MTGSPAPAQRWMPMLHEVLGGGGGWCATRHTLTPPEWSGGSASERPRMFHCISKVSGDQVCPPSGKCDGRKAEGSACVRHTIFHRQSFDKTRSKASAVAPARGGDAGARCAAAGRVACGAHTPDRCGETWTGLARQVPAHSVTSRIHYPISAFSSTASAAPQQDNGDNHERDDVACLI